VTATAPAPLRILVADDERDIVSTLTVILEDEGHEVHAVHRGPEVLRAVLALDPDAVLLDIGLPELSGHEVARKIRECCGDARPMLIGISGRYKRGADKSLAHLNGMNHYLVKPFDPNAVIAFLSTLTKKPD
jgi:DNA-binding response OmpR family regulator